MGRTHRDRRNQVPTKDGQAHSGLQTNSATDDPAQGQRCPGGEEARRQDGSGVENRF